MIFSSEVFTHYSPLITDEQIHYGKKLLLFSFFQMSGELSTVIINDFKHAFKSL